MGCTIGEVLKELAVVQTRLDLAHRAAEAELEIIHTKLYAARRALKAAEQVLSRNADEEQGLFRDGSVLQQVREALALTEPQLHRKPT